MPSSSSRLPQMELTKVPRPTSLPPPPPLVWAAGNQTDTTDDNNSSNKRQELAELYKRVRDENELLEFKNYELLFKIQELEQNQRKLLGSKKREEEEEEVCEKKELQNRPPTTKLPPPPPDDGKVGGELRQHDVGDDGADSEDAARPGQHPAAPSSQALGETVHASLPICGSHDIDLVGAGSGVDSSSSSSSTSTPSSSSTPTSGQSDVGGHQCDGAAELIEYNGGADKAKVAKVEQQNPNQICAVGRTPATRHDRRQVDSDDGQANKWRQSAASSLATSGEFGSGESLRPVEDRQDRAKKMLARAAKTTQAQQASSRARSQPDLTSGSIGPHQLRGARIAVPVARRSISGAQQPPTTGANNDNSSSGCGTGRTPAATSQLRVRSKSNLDAPALAHRPRQHLTLVAPQASAKPSITRAPATLRRQAAQELITNAPSKLPNSVKVAAASTGQPTMRARSSSSMGFATQIPTLIGGHTLPANNNDNYLARHQQAAARSRSMSSVAAAKSDTKDLTAADHDDDHCQDGFHQEPVRLCLVPEAVDQKPPPANIRTAVSLSCVFTKDTSLSEPLAQSKGGSSDVTPAKGCNQCKLLEAKLSQAVKDRRLASEQLSELEELENDSRLMSQKLGQQLVQLQQQLELANRELSKTRDDEAKLQFQNKRLNFELKQRLESIQQLQCQVSRLQTKALVRERAAVAEQLKVQSAASSSRKEEEVSPATSSDDGEPTASLSNSDDDSAIDLFDKKQRLPSSSSGVDEPLGAEETIQDVCNDVKIKEETSVEHNTADDSAYSKSSASSDDGSGQAMPMDAQRAPSSSSSGDESDHHQASSATGLPVVENAAMALAGRQQVLRKKISTARILRGIQVHQSSLHHANPEPPSLLRLNQARLVPVASDEKENGEKIAAVTSKNHADLALEGIKDLEEGRGDQLLRSLTEPIQSPLPKQSKQQEEEATQVTCQQFKQDIANLRQQLIQAHTLNDNLVGELRSSQDRFAKLETYLNGQQPRASSFLGQQKQVTSSPTDTNNVADGLAQARRSIIYVNGPRASCANDSSNNNNRPTSLNIGWLQQQQHQGLRVNKNYLNYGNNNNHQVNGVCCVNLDELLELLRSLLDKIHFHHGRTFELVSECQRLAMSALVASHSHQMNMLSHNSVVLAGQQASNSQQSDSNSQTYPVKPPPRRRNRTTNMPTEEQLMEQLPAEQEEAKQVLQLPPPTSRSTSGRTSALQVAKQTLFSIVPIYYNSSSNSNSGVNGVKNNKEKAIGSSKPTNLNKHQHQPLVESAKGNGEQQQQEALRNKGWILLNQSAPAQANKINHHHQWPNHTSTAREQEQHLLIRPQTGGGLNVSNVSVLEINRSQQIYHSTSCSNDQQQSNCYANLQNHHQFTHQQLHRVRHSLSEDIERYRGHFNGQLLDLMTRQNWCESIITEKVKFYQNKQLEFNGCHNNINNNNVINVSQGLLNQHNPKDSLAAKVVYDQTKLVNVPTINSSSANGISLDSNVINSQQQQVIVTNQGSTQSQWIANGGDHLHHHHHQLAQSLC